MRYLLLIYGDESSRPAMDPEDQAAQLELWTGYSGWLREKGWYVGGEALEDTPAATTVRERDGKTMTTDGPFAETKEQLGGFYLVQCENLDEAIEAASKIPSLAFGGTVEVRPIMEFPE
jgi:hypothetical protein